MSTLPPPRRSEPAPEARPKRSSGWVLPIGVVVLAVASGLVWYLWSRVAALEDRVNTAETRASQLDRQLELSRREAEELRHRSDTAQAQAEDAQRAAEREAAARQQAEFGREFARERAEQAQLESERAETEASRSRQELTQLQSARKRELDRMQEALGRIAETSRTPLGMVVNLGEDKFLFEFDKADLKPDNRELLSRIAGVLLASHGYRIQIYGHTDDVGDDQYNQQLSERRAQAVRDYLVKAGVPEDIIESKGFGKTSPRVEAKTNDARRKNRRVEIGVVDTVISYDKLNATEN
jgi:outer membrane protein OmpA-like peptidoglycan-associated protein